MKRTTGWAALAVAMLAAGTVRADFDGRQFGNWLATAKSDRFGDGGTYYAAAFDGDYSFGVRCLNNTFSYAVIPGGDKLRRKTLNKFKFRVDDGKIYFGAGFALSDSIVQLFAAPGLTADIVKGKELAIRHEVDGAVQTRIIKLRGASKALAEVIAHCPLEKQTVPKFDDDGNIDVDSLKKE